MNIVEMIVSNTVDERKILTVTTRNSYLKEEYPSLEYYWFIRLNNFIQRNKEKE